MSERRSGRSTEQIKAAPRAGVFIAPSRDSLRYFVELARSLGRGDLRIKTPTFLDGAGRRHPGARIELVIDHAALEMLIGRQLAGLEQLKKCLGPPRPWTVCGRLPRGISPVAVFGNDATLHATRNTLCNAATRCWTCISIRRLRETVSSTGPTATEFDNKIAKMLAARFCGRTERDMTCEPADRMLEFL